jgi:hypothetical protein
MKDLTIASASASPLSSQCLAFLFLFTSELTVEDRMKSLLFALVRAFEFEPVVPTGAIAFSLTPVMRPRVLAEPEGGNQRELIVRSFVPI